MRYFSLVLAAGILCSDGPLLARKPAIKPIQVIDAGGADIALSPNGQWLFCFNGDGTLSQIIDLTKGKKLPPPRKLRGERIYGAVHVKKDVWLLALNRPQFLADDKGLKTRFVLFDFATETIQADWMGHKDKAGALAVVPKQNWFITAGTGFEDHTVCFWDRKTLKKVGEMDLVQELRLPPPGKGEGIQLKRMAIDPTASFLAFGIDEGVEGVIHVWDLNKKTWHPVQEKHKGQKEYKGTLESLCFLDSRTLVIRWSLVKLEGWILKRVVTWNVLEVYDWKAGKVLFRVDRKSDLSDIASSPNGRLLAFGENSRDEGWVRLWDVAARREVAAFKAYEDSIHDKMLFTHDGKRLITSGWEAPEVKIKVWDVERILKTSKP